MSRLDYVLRTGLAANAARLSRNALDTDVVLTSPLPKSCPVCLEDFYVIRKDVNDEESEILHPDDWTLALDKNGNEKRIAILPCSHAVCLPCARTMAARGDEQRKCPICRVPFSEADLRHVLDRQDDDDDDAPQNAPAAPVDPMDLIDAAQEGDAARVTEMLHAGFDVDTRSMFRAWTALMHASSNGRTDVVRLLLERGADVNLTSNIESTALIIASHQGYIYIVRALLAVQGINIQRADVNGNTALMMASENGYEEIVRALLDAGAAVNRTNNYGQTALTLARLEGHDDIVTMLEAAQHALADPTAYREWVDAAREGNLARVQEMLAAGTDVDDADPSGWTALMWASYGDHAAVVRALLAAEPSANVNAMSNHGWTALMIASQNGYADVVRALLAAGADVGATRDNETALDMARYHGETEVVALLEAAQDAQNPPPAPEAPPVQVSYFEFRQAARDGNLARVRELLAAGADVDAPDHNGVTALMKASLNGLGAVVDVLLAAGADVNQADNNNGDTALMWASDLGHADVVRALIRAGADIHKANRRGVTALMWARRNGHPEVVAMLEAAQNA